MKFPSIVEVRKALIQTHNNLRCMNQNDLKVPGTDFIGTDVRLQVTENGWQILSGDSSYDQSHQGQWGSSSISYRRQNLEKVAKDLIRQAKSDY